MDLTKPIEEMTERELRIASRIGNLYAGIKRVRARMDANPAHPLAARMAAKLMEYKQSLENLKAHGVEVLPEPGAGVTGVTIEVPSYDYNATAQAPGKEG